MATNVATLTAKMAMDVSNFQRGVGQVKSGLNSLQGAATVSSGVVGKLAGGLLAGAVAAKVFSSSLAALRFAADKTFQAISVGFGAAMESEQATIAFKTMLGSMEEAVALKKDIETFALATPFDVKGTTDAVRTLKARNIATKELLPTLKTLGDLSMGDSERLKHLALAYSQVMQKNKLMAQEANLQFPEAGINVVKAVADEMRITIPEVTKLMEEGKISAAIVRNALITLSETKFGGSLEDQAKTAMGALNRLREVGILTMKDMAEGMMKKFSVGDNLNDLASMAEVFRDEIAPKLVDGLASVADQLIDTFSLMESILHRSERLGLLSLGTTAVGGGGLTTNAARQGMAALATPETAVQLATGVNLRALDAILGLAAPGEAEGGTMRDWWQDMKNKVFDQRINDAYFSQEGLKKGPIPGAATAVTSALGSLFKGTGGALGSLAFNAGIKGGRGVSFLESLLPAAAEKPGEFRPTGAIEAGSREAMSAIVRNMLGGEKKGMDEKQLKAAQDALKVLRDILTQTTKAARDTADVIGSFSG
jgi:tape measure domain-containing protein